MPRKRNARLEIRVQLLKKPRSMDPDSYLRAILRGVDTGTLPRGLDVELHWRNPETRSGRSRQWQSGPFSEVIQDSSQGFGTVLRRMIQRRMYTNVPRFTVKPKRKVARHEKTTVKSGKRQITKKKSKAKTRKPNLKKRY